MSKGYWLVTTTVTDLEGFGQYVEGFSLWIEAIGGKLLAKDLDAKTVEGNGGHLAVIIEFPSKVSAKNAYESADYQELSKLRFSNSKDTNIIIMDGGVSH